MLKNLSPFSEVFKKLYSGQELSHRIDGALESLKPFTPNGSLKGSRFLDAGCGGGLISAAAVKLGAQAIVSFDYDSDLVETCDNLRKKLAPNIKWETLEGSILEINFLKGLGKFDYVYCWGVVHHTGNMKKALENIIQLVDDGGYIYLGIYNNASAFGFWDDRRFGSSSQWEFIKRIICKMPRFMKRFISFISTSIYFLMCHLEILFGKYRFKDFSDRGMDSTTSIEDWLFGYPYEYASVDEVFDFMTKNGFVLRKIDSNIGLRTNNYLFHKIDLAPL